MASRSSGARASGCALPCACGHSGPRAAAAVPLLPYSLGARRGGGHGLSIDCDFDGGNIRCPSDADRLPAGRGSDASLGERGPGGGRTAVARQQDRRADGAAVAGGGGRTRRPAPRSGQSLGHCRQEAGRAHLTDLQHPWRRIRARAGLDDVRIHDLRHSFASRALALGESLPMIGKLLGHTQVQTTARYAHLARDSVKAEDADLRSRADTLCNRTAALQTGTVATRS